MDRVKAWVAAHLVADEATSAMLTRQDRDPLRGVPIRPTWLPGPPTPHVCVVCNGTYSYAPGTPDFEAEHERMARARDVWAHDPDRTTRREAY